MVRMRSSSILIKGSKARDSYESLLLWSLSAQSSGCFHTYHGCALAAPAVSFAGAEPSVSRSRLGEKRSVLLYASIEAPGRRRRQAKAIRPQIASMVRMRSSSILIKGSNMKKEFPNRELLFYVEVYSQDRAVDHPCHGCAPGCDSRRDEAAEPSMARSRQVEERSVQRYASTVEPG